MARTPIRSSQRASPPATSIATCEECGTTFTLGTDDGAAICAECFTSYLTSLEVPFLEQYARFGAKARRTVAEAMFRALVTADPDDRKVMGMRIVEEYLAAAQELIGLYLSIRNRDRTPIVRTFMDFELNDASMAVFRAMTEGRSDEELLRDLGFPTLADVEAARGEVGKRDFKQMRAAVTAVPQGLERVRRVEAGALLQLNQGLKRSRTLAQQTDWIPDGGIQPHQVALLVLERQQRKLLTHTLSIDERQLETFIGALDQITRTSRDLIWLYLHVEDT
jgi:hypothetical protein